MKNLTLKEPAFDQVYVGETLRARSVMADERFLRQGMFALDDYGSWYTREFAPLRERIVSSAMVLRDLHFLIGYYYDPARMMGLHQREKVRFHRPVPLGTRMIYNGRFSDKFVKRGKGYVVYEAEARDAASGELLVSQTCTEIMRVAEKFARLEEDEVSEPAKRVVGRKPKGRAEAVIAQRGLPIGTPVKGLTKRAFQDQMSVFSGCDMQWVNIHTSIDRALEGNYRDTVLPGLMQTCWLSEMAANFFGEKWLYTGALEHVYLKPVFRDDEITCHGMVVEDDSGDNHRLLLEVWTTNQAGEMTTVGWISGAVA